MSSQFTTERRSSDDRRGSNVSPAFPFFDSEQTLVREDRRRIPERRISNIEIHNNDIGRSATKRLFLWYQDDVFELFTESPEVIAGRGPSCAITFFNRYTSRQHAKFQFEDNEFSIADQSTNGTYIKNDEGEIFLMGEKMPLHGSGIISLGTPIEYVEKDVIHYFCP